jgi:hypothetical protein
MSNSIPVIVEDINDLADRLLTDDIIRYVPSVVQNEWQTYKLYKNRNYYTINRNLQNTTNLYFIERDYYKYQLERCNYTIDIIKNYSVNNITAYLTRNPQIGIQLKSIYNQMMDYLHKDKNIYEEKLKKIN